jgi:hypothetical protein
MIPSIVKNNPFRVLGCFANCTAKERISNKSRLSAFARVNKTCDFPSDMKEILGDVTRTPSSIAEAEQALNLPEDQIKYALFWFVKSSPLDQVALGHASVADLDKAKEIWKKRDCWSSSLNLGVLALTQGDLDDAVDHLTTLVHDAEQRSQFLSAIGPDSTQIDETQLARVLINELKQSFSWEELLNSYQSYGSTYDDDEYIQSQAISEPIKTINESIDKIEARRVTPYNAEVYCRQLLNETSEALSFLDEHADSDSVQKSMVCDKLAKQLSWLADKITDDRTEDLNALRQARMYTQKALEIAQGDSAIEECKSQLSSINSLMAVVEVKPLVDKVLSEGVKLITGSPTLAEIESFIPQVRNVLQKIIYQAGSDGIEPMADTFLKPVVGAIIDCVNRSQSNKQQIMQGLRDGSLVKTVDHAMRLFMQIKAMPISDELRRHIDKQYAAAFKMRNDMSEVQERVQHQSNSSCFVATLAYCDNNHPNVQTLREFRDRILSKNRLGKWFIRFYYANSPYWVVRLASHQIIVSIIRKMLDVFVGVYRYVRK